MHRDCPYYTKCIQYNNFRCPETSLNCLTGLIYEGNVISFQTLKDQNKHKSFYTEEQVQVLKRTTGSIRDNISRTAYSQIQERARNKINSQRKANANRKDK